MPLLRTLQNLTGLIVAGGYLFSRRPLRRLPAEGSISLQQRLTDLPTQKAPLRRKVQIYWNEYQVPFVEAENDEDLAVALGVVHVHLRWSQMEMMRRVSQGRLAEVIGPLGIDIDYALRVLGVERAVPTILANLPSDTMSWLEAFVAGINHAISKSAKLPWELSILGLDREQWSISDVLTLGRLISVDVTWIPWSALLRQPPNLASALWRRLVGFGGTSKSPDDPLRTMDLPLAAAVQRFGRTGSNSVAVSPRRSTSGGAWLASDPHLEAALPNPWLIAGYKSPSYCAVGLMVPGLPLIALGRNKWIAWGGTNLHAAASELIDVSDLPAAAMSQRRERIHVRCWPDQDITIRETACGPVISDIPFLRNSTRPAYALRWVGHLPSDEITAMLGINRARNWKQFKAALALFAVPAQNFVYADAEGHIGKAIAARLPRRTLDPPKDPVVPRSAAADWENFIFADNLPTSFDPEEGFVVSANEKPKDMALRIGYLFSPNDRFERLTDRLADWPRVGFNELAALQQDVLLQSALGLRELLVQHLKSLPRARATRAAAQLIEELRRWDGRYTVESSGALAIELLAFRTAVALVGRKQAGLYSLMWDAYGLLRADIETASQAQIVRALQKAVPATMRGLAAFHNWGGMHRMHLAHFLSPMPLMGRRLQFADRGVPGTRTTVLQTAGPLTDRRHFVRLIATARHVSDLSDPDANYFVILGGQDGWLGSTTMLDQVALWREGRYVQLPMRLEAVRAKYTFKTELLP
jgi:penicillin G amidase